MNISEIEKLSSTIDKIDNIIDKIEKIKQDKNIDLVPLLRDNRIINLLYPRPNNEYNKDTVNKDTFNKDKLKLYGIGKSAFRSLELLEGSGYNTVYRYYKDGILYRHEKPAVIVLSNEGKLLERKWYYCNGKLSKKETYAYHKNFGTYVSSTEFYDIFGQIATVINPDNKKFSKIIYEIIEQPKKEDTTLIKKLWLFLQNQWELVESTIVDELIIISPPYI